MEEQNERQRNVRHKRGSKIILVFILATVLLLAVWAISAAAGALSTVDEIIITGESPYTEKQILSSVGEYGIVPGMKMKKIDVAAAERGMLCDMPYIETADIKQKLGGKVTINVTSEKALYVTNISNEYFVISDKLKVLSTSVYDPASANDNLISVRFPDVRRAIVGEKLYCFEDTAYIDRFIDTLESHGLFDRISVMDVSDKYALSVVYDERFEIHFGELSDMEIKLNLVNLMLGDEQIKEQSSVLLDVSDTSRPTLKVLG